MNSYSAKNIVSGQHQIKNHNINAQQINTDSQYSQQRAHKHNDSINKIIKIIRIHQNEQDIERAQGILKQAAKRLKSGEISQKVLQNRQKQLKNCYDLLQDVKESQEGGIYRPPEYPSLQQIKMKLLDIKQRDKQGDQEINMEEQIAFDQFNQKDKKMDQVLDQIIDVNKRVKEKMKGSNQAIDITRDKIKNINTKTDQMITRVKKADTDLAQILKSYQRPSQLCLNITLILMILALIAVIVDLFKSPTK